MSHKLAKKIRKHLKQTGVDWRDTQYEDISKVSSIRNVRKLFSVKKISEDMLFATHQTVLASGCGRAIYQTEKGNGQCL